MHQHFGQLQQSDVSGLATALAGKAAAAAGVPTGGTAGQVLSKTGTPDHEMAWANLSVGIGGIVDCSAMTTVAAINAASAAAPAGSIIWLGPRPSGAELIAETTLILRPNQKILGAGGRSRLTRILAGAAFPAGQPLVAASGYMTNGASADSPANIEGVDIDCASKVGSHGLVVYNFWSHFEDIQVHNAAGNGTLNSAAGLLITDRAINGTTTSNNSHSENTFKQIRCNAFTAGASAVVQQSFNGASNQDGHLIECWFAGINGRGLDFVRTAGWTLADIHMYGIGDDAAKLLACFATDVTGFYVEGYGGNDVAADNYHGLQMEFLTTRASTLNNVKISSNQPDNPAAARFANYYLRAGSGQTRAQVTITGCSSVTSRTTAPTAAKSQAWRLGESGDTARMLYIEWAGNQTDPSGYWMNPTRFIHATTVTMREAATTLSPTRVVAYSATPSIDPVIDGNNINITATGDITSLAVPTTSAVDRQVIRIAVLGSGATRAVTFAAAIRTSTGLTRGPFSIASGQVLLAAVEYSALISAWVLTAATISAT